MKKSYLIALVIAVLAVIWVASGAMTPASEPPPQAAHAEEKKIFEVRVRDIAAEKITSQVIVTGRTYASRAVELKAETAGQVTEIVAEKGTAVTEGQVMARIEQRDRKARVAEAKERLQQRQIEYNAAKELQEKGFNSKVRLAQAAADLEAAKAELERYKLDLENTDVTAPFEGVIATQAVETGDYVAVGDMLFGVVDLSPVELRAYVTERQVREIALGRVAQVEFVGGVRGQGEVTYIAPAADPQTRTFAVEISMPNEDGAIIEGLTARIMIPAAERTAHKISPAVLSLNDAGQVGVKIVTDENKVEFMPVSIIADQSGYMLVGGLPEKIRLITVGQDYVSPGQTVTPVPAEGDGLL